MIHPQILSEGYTLEKGVGTRHRLRPHFHKKKQKKEVSCNAIWSVFVDKEELRKLVEDAGDAVITYKSPNSTQY